MIEIFLAIFLWYFAPVPWLTTVIHILISKNLWHLNKVKIPVIIFFTLIWLFLGYWIISNFNFLFVDYFSNLATLVSGILILVIAVVIEIFTEKALGRRKILLIDELNQTADKLTTFGIYKFARHPRYIEHSLIFFGFGLIFGYVSLLWVALYLFISFAITAHFEDKELIKRYGKEYLKYKKKTPAFFIGGKN